MLTLHTLVSAGKKRKRVGRGGARGGTSGRGMGGQKARTGAGVGVAFEGGQMPLARRLPKRGFSNARFTREYVIFNVKDLNSHFESGDIVTYESLSQKGLVKSRKPVAVKILGTGVLEKKLTVHAHAFSAGAQKAIADRGGEFHVIQE